MSDEIPWLFSEKMSLYSMTDGQKLVHDNDKLIILLEGSIVVEHQGCDSCRPKKTTLNKLGSSILISRGTHHRVRNVQMGRAYYIEVITNFSESE